jgi:hypothetical protein
MPCLLPLSFCGTRAERIWKRRNDSHQATKVLRCKGGNGSGRLDKLRDGSRLVKGR